MRGNRGYRFELSGSELVALLMESAAIKHHYPLYNRAQKKKVQAYGVFAYEDRSGIVHLAFNKLKMAPNALATFYNPTDCRLYLEQICRQFELCPKYCHLQVNVKAALIFELKVVAVFVGIQRRFRTTIPKSVQQYST